MGTHAAGRRGLGKVTVAYWYTLAMDVSSLPDEVKELVRTQIESGHFQISR